eukprot:CAMPEP_0168628474 /NCGR_PEP_ID=MMETSP0449_2-20121227/11868_1 /TAXON_ID=1082188 /ORGANISM="Strombidium rassoulzadegani, Strain ras09" /LENGTH=77 /DNA_ID=CAMNT_0008670905 /DNA_START=926 /DNA_END=1156 /DNA_ORIENTATION=+
MKQRFWLSDYRFALDSTQDLIILSQEAVRVIALDQQESFSPSLAEEIEMRALSNMLRTIKFEHRFQLATRPAYLIYD